jgi:hypothetical protein
VTGVVTANVVDGVVIDTELIDSIEIKDTGAMVVLVESGEGPVLVCAMV